MSYIVCACNCQDRHVPDYFHQYASRPVRPHSSFPPLQPGPSHRPFCPSEPTEPIEPPFFRRGVALREKNKSIYSLFFSPIVPFIYIVAQVAHYIYKPLILLHFSLFHFDPVGGSLHHQIGTIHLFSFQFTLPNQFSLFSSSRPHLSLHHFRWCIFCPFRPLFQYLRNAHTALIVVPVFVLPDVFWKGPFWQKVGRRGILSRPGLSPTPQPGKWVFRNLFSVWNLVLFLSGELNLKENKGFLRGGNAVIHARKIGPIAAGSGQHW